MSAVASQITSVSIVCSTVGWGADKKTTKKHQSSASLAVTSELPVQKASNVKNVSIWWRHHVEHMFIIDKKVLPFKRNGDFVGKT